MNVGELRAALEGQPDDAEVVIEGCDGCDGPVGKVVEMHDFKGGNAHSHAVFGQVAYLTRADSIYWPQVPGKDDAT